jgi:hypothetical protein
MRTDKKIVFEKGSAALIREILTSVIAILVMRGRVPNPRDGSVIGISSATPDSRAAVIGAAIAMHPGVTKLLMRVLDEAKPMAEIRNRRLPQLWSDARISVEVKPIAEWTSHQFMEQDPEGRLVRDLSKLDIPAADAEALIGGL